MKTYSYKFQEGNVFVSGTVRAADSKEALAKLDSAICHYYPNETQLTEKRTINPDKWDRFDYVLALLICLSIAGFAAYLHHLAS